MFTFALRSSLWNCLREVWNIHFVISWAIKVLFNKLNKENPWKVYLATLCLCLTASTCSLSSKGWTFAASFSTLSVASCKIRRVQYTKLLFQLKNFWIECWNTKNQSNQNGQLEERKYFNSQREVTVKPTKMPKVWENDSSQVIISFSLICIWLVERMVQVFYINHRMK